MATEEEELQRAIEESQKEYEGHQARIKAEEMRKEEEAKKVQLEEEERTRLIAVKTQEEQRMKESEEIRKKQEAEAEVKAAEEAKAREVEEAKQQEAKVKAEEAKRAEEESKAALPPVVVQKQPQVKITESELNRGKMSTENEMSEQERLSKMAADIIAQNTEKAAASATPGSQTKESLEDRQARLKAQREALLAKKKAEREKELSDYAEQGGIGAKGAIQASEHAENTIPNQEMEKRQRLAAKLRHAMQGSYNA